MELLKTLFSLYSWRKLGTDKTCMRKDVLNIPDLMLYRGCESNFTLANPLFAFGFILSCLSKMSNSTSMNIGYIIIILFFRSYSSLFDT